MTDKEVVETKLILVLVLGLVAGIILGATVTGIRYNSEIRTDQVELKEQVAEIKDDEQVIQDLTTELLSQIKQIKADRKALEELKIILSKGELND